MGKRILNVGCGADTREGYVNLDKYKYPGVNVVHDLNKTPLPFKEKEFDAIIAQDILEHVNYVKLMPELFRVLKEGGTIKIRVPHFLYRNSYTDCTHINRFCVNTFLESFVKKDKVQDSLYGLKLFSRCKTYLEFEKRLLMPWNYLIEFLVNSSSTGLDFYERTPLRIFPPKNILVELTR